MSRKAIEAKTCNPQNQNGKRVAKTERETGGPKQERTQIQKRMSTRTRRVVPHEVERLAQHLDVRSDDLQLIIRQEKCFERVAASGGGGKGPALDKSIA